MDHPGPGINPGFIRRFSQGEAGNLIQ